MKHTEPTNDDLPFDHDPDALLDCEEVCRLVKLSRVTIRRRWHLGTFPAPFRNESRPMRWPARVIRAYLTETGMQGR